MSYPLKITLIKAKNGRSPNSRLQKMVKIFDYLFLFLKKQYLKGGEKDIPEFVSICALGLLLSSNLFVLGYMLYKLNILRITSVDKKLIVVLSLAILFGLRLYFDKIRKIYRANPDEEVVKYNSNVIRSSYMYLILSSVIFLTLFIILSTKNSLHINYPAGSRAAGSLLKFNKHE